MGQYTKNGLYNAYKKNNKEREALDYYATPTVEVRNILDTLGYDFSGMTILEPCVGGGHMAQAIYDYVVENKQCGVKLIGSDVKDRGFRDDNWSLSYGHDFLGDDYPFDSADIIVMNPPYAILEPFMIRALEIAKKKLVVLGRIQAVEGEGRYEKIYADNPPTDLYQYVDRIQCWRDGTEPEGSSAQGYMWLVWDFENKPADGCPRFHWIRRDDKKEKNK